MKSAETPRLRRLNRSLVATAALLGAGVACSYAARTADPGPQAAAVDAPPPPRPTEVTRVEPNAVPSGTSVAAAKDDGADERAEPELSPVQEVPKAAKPSGPAKRALAQTGSFEGREAGYNPPTLAAEDSLSTFAIDVDTAAYSIARRSLDANQLPTPSLVRVEEMINYFHYDYDPPEGARHPFSIQVDGARSPVDPSKHILRVGLQARVVEQPERLPANLVFLVDTSCSMTSDDKLELAKKSLKIAVEGLGAKDQVAITTYAGGVSVILPPTSGDQKATIRRAIDSLASGGGTAMESGLTLAYQQAARMLREGEISRIIVCSDGDANIGATSPDEMLKQVQGYVAEGVTISTIGFGDGNYKDVMMEQIANRGNGNYYYIDTMRQAERVFGRDLTKMLQDVAQDVKIQVELSPKAVASYRLVGYENRNIADQDFRNDRVDAGEIGAGHQVTALYELTLTEEAEGELAVVHVRAKEPRGTVAKETAVRAPVSLVKRDFAEAPSDLRFATAVMGSAELLRQSPHARGWTYARVISIISDTSPARDPDRAELLALMKKAAWLAGETGAVSTR
ncbi:von Willebrand factor type A domain-containing protein [Myxococcota bacterium]|nr:von Willebrand factor type A domain-containing protein [Myxococcota bacterium]